MIYVACPSHIQLDGEYFTLKALSCLYSADKDAGMHLPFSEVMSYDVFSWMEKAFRCTDKLVSSVVSRWSFSPYGVPMQACGYRPGSGSHRSQPQVLTAFIERLHKLDKFRPMLKLGRVHSRSRMKECKMKTGKDFRSLEAGRHCRRQDLHYQRPPLLVHCWSTVGPILHSLLLHTC